MNNLKIAPPISNYNYRNLFFILFLLSTVFTLNFFRTPDAFINPQLWAEDALIFLKKAQEIGWESLLIPYAGYLHLLPRLAAVIVEKLGVSITYVPLVYNSISWLIISGCVIILTKLPLGLKRQHHRIILALTLIVVPVGSEVFSNLTNIQWITAVALTLILASEYKNLTLTFKLVIATFILLVGMTGPFSILLSPLILFRILIKKDVNKTLYLYIPWFFSALVQTFFIVTSKRAAINYGLELNVYLLGEAFFINFLGGYFKLLSIYISLPITLVVITLTISKLYLSKLKNDSDFILASILGMFFVFCLAGLLSHKHAPNILHPFGSGARYFYIPYVLYFMILIINFFESKGKIKLFYCFLLSVTIITFIFNGQRNSYHNLRWKEYSSYINKVDGLTIPINPLFPAWYLSLNSTSTTSSSGEMKMHSFNHNEISPVNIRGWGEEWSNDLSPVTNNPQLYIIPSKCTYPEVLYRVDAKFIPNSGSIVIYYGNKKNDLSEKNSMALPIVDGMDKYYFIVPSISNIIRIDPVSNLNKFKINSIESYCLK